MPSQLLLSWKDHHGALVSVFENLLKSNTLVDCTLAAEGQYLKAHKVVLSACSSYFELLFSQESEKNPIVILKDVKFQELEAAVNFMYRGEVEVCEDRLGAFLEVAESLEIKGLGSDGKSQDSKGKTPVKSSKTVTTRQHTRKEVVNTQSENIGESTNTLDSDQNSNNESSPHHHQSRRETSGSSPIPSTLAIASSYSIASASTSCPVRPDAGGDRDNLDNNQCSSPAVSLFPLRDTMPTGVDTVIKTEPATDTYLDEKSDETERDFDDVTMMEDQEDWDDPNPESMGDSHGANQHDHAYSAADMKTNQTSDNTTDAPVAEHPSSEGAGSCAGSWASVMAKKTPWTPWKQRPGGGRFGSRPFTGPKPPVPPADSGPAGAECITIFPSVYHLKRSLASAAADDKPHRCTECEYSTALSGDLKKHQRVHTGERPYECSECGAAFAQSNDLRRHLRTHTGERPYRCELCTAAFSRGSCLRDHQRAHAGKRYLCPECSKTFASRGSLRYHLRVNHRISAAAAAAATVS